MAALEQLSARESRVRAVISSYPYPETNGATWAGILSSFHFHFHFLFLKVIIVKLHLYLFSTQYEDA